MAHFFGVSPMEVRTWGGWFAFAQSYMDWYIKEEKKRFKNSRHKSNDAPKNRRIDVLEQRKGGLGNGRRNSGTKASPIP